MEITMSQVYDYHIRNEHLRNSLQVPDILETMRQRQFRSLGNFARLPLHRLPRRFITAWVGKSRSVGQPRFTLRNTLNDTIGSILGVTISNNGSRIKDWIPQTAIKSQWDELAKNWIESCKAQTLTAHGYHPLLDQPNVPPVQDVTPQMSSHPN